MSIRSRVAPGVSLGLVVALVAAAFATSAQVAATASAQSGVTTLSAPYVQPGSRPASSERAKLVGTVRFQPVREGRPVVIQRSLDNGSSWEYVATRKQNGSGVVTFTAARSRDGAPYMYRGKAKRWGALSPFRAAAQTADVWRQAFVDEFKGTSLNTAKWADRRPASKECARVGVPAAREVRRGTLRLMVKLDPRKLGRRCRVPGYGKFRYYLNGQVSTEHVPHAFEHGTLSARIKFHENRGAHGAFWMQPVTRNYEARPVNAGAEIDIAEFFGKGYPKGGLASFLYNYAPGCSDKSGDPRKIGGLVPKATRMLPERDAWWKRFHVFSLEWTQNAYRFSVDGRTHSVITKCVTSVDEYLILGLMTSAWELKQAKRLGVRPQGTMQVDWVRVWQKD